MTFTEELKGMGEWDVAGTAAGILAVAAMGASIVLVGGFGR